MPNLKMLKNFTAKRRNGFDPILILIGLAVIIALSVGAFFGYNSIQQSRKMAQMRQDMEAICTAAQAYEAMSLTSTPPASIQALITGLTASDSVDGAAHKFLSQSKGNSTSTDKILDPWGQEYVYNQASRTVSCTPKDESGTAQKTAVVRNF